MPDRAVLIATSEGDLSADRVILALAAHDVEIVRADPARVPTTLRFGERRASPAGRIAGCDFDRIAAVYWRRPSKHSLPGADPRTAAWAAREYDHGIRAGLWSLPVRWVNHPARQAAASKPAQLHAAARFGLTVPPTLITNDLEEAKEFAARYPSVTKTFTGPPEPEPGDTFAHTSFTRPVDLGELDEGVEMTSHLFQERIFSVRDVRITVVGEQLFPAYTETETLDWRRENQKWSALPETDVPAVVAQAIRQMMARFDLLYAAFDFGVDAEGRWWFYELNPSGQFGFVEIATGLPIAAAVAACLTSTTP